MNKIVFHNYGNPLDVLQVERGSPPEAPGPGQVLIKVLKRPLHNGDLLMVQGGHDPIKRHIPPSGYSPGCEGVGIIKALGSDVNNDARGLCVEDRVAFFAVGTWQDLILVEAEFVTPVPDDIEDAVAAQLFINPVAAMVLTRLVKEIASNPQAVVLRIAAVEDVVENLNGLKIDAGVVLLSVAGSTVARLSATILKAQGYIPIGLVRSSSSVAALEEEIGISVVGFDNNDWEEQVRRLAGGSRIFAALDAVGGKVGEAILGLLSPAGTLISYGSLTGEPIPVDHVHLCMTAKKVCGIGMVHWTQLPYKTRAADMKEIMDRVRDHQKFFRIAGEYPLSKIADAVRLFRERGRQGTVLLTS